MTQSILISSCLYDDSIKDKLRSGEMTVPGDHWPVFLYAGYDYDPEDPWKGLFRSPILVSVSWIIANTIYVLTYCNYSRHTSMSSHLQARSRRRPRLRDLATLGYTV